MTTQLNSVASRSRVSGSSVFAGASSARGPNGPSVLTAGAGDTAACDWAGAVAVPAGARPALVSVRAVIGGGIGASCDFTFGAAAGASGSGRTGTSSFADSGGVTRFAVVEDGSVWALRRTSRDDCSRLNKMTNVRIAIPIAMATAFRLA